MWVTGVLIPAVHLRDEPGCSEEHVHFQALPVPGAWLGVALPVWGAVPGIWVGSTRGRGHCATLGRGITWAGLIASTGLGGGNSRL